MTLLVIDLGSSSVRALLFDDAARLIPGAVRSRRYDFDADKAGRATADPLALQNLVESCIDDVLRHPSAATIRAVGLATFVGNWLGLDAAGKACTPVLTYADASGAAEIPALLRKFDGKADAYRQATGCPLHSAYLPAQYLSWRRRQPDSARRIHSLSDIGGYLYRQWFARAMPMSLSVASWSGLLDTKRRDWHWTYAGDLLGHAFPARLPPLADYDNAQSGLKGDYAARWSQLRDVPFFLALGDGAAANIGSGAVSPGQIALTIGTTSALRVVKEIEILPPGLWRYLVCADMPLVGGAASEGGNVYQWLMKDLLRAADTLDAELDQRPADCHGLTVLPLLAGERSPGWQPNAAGTIHGIRRNTSRLDILQAHLEAVALRLSMIHDRLKTEGALVMAGGGALQSSAVWAGIIANAFDAPLQLLAEPEITARGVALMLRRALDGTGLAEPPPRISGFVQPDPAAVSALRAARERQIDLYRRLYA